MNLFNYTIGLDEVGRGCLAGPVVAAAVLWPPAENFSWVEEIRDSKKLTAKKRERLAIEIQRHCMVSIREVPAETIDEMNILWASLYAMRLALDDLYQCVAEDSKPTLALIDGNHNIPTANEAGYNWLQAPIKQYTCVGGDDIHKCIGAASIVAKVYRDKLMADLDRVYPQYGFAQHAGYGTQAHRDAIKNYGPCPEHRRTFKGVLLNVAS